VTALTAAAEASTQMDEAFFRQVGTIDWSRG